jgi:hypothetical protein
MLPKCLRPDPVNSSYLGNGTIGNQKGDGDKAIVREKPCSMLVRGR